MKIIDAINKINKEEKFRFRLLCDGDIYKYIGGSLYNETIGMRAEWIIDNKWLNEEIEIIEEEKKIPEKLETYKEIDDEKHFANILKVSKNGECEIDEATSVIADKVNEIIDYLKSKGDE